MARAVSFNLRYRVAEIEREIAQAELEKSNFDMLPTLDVNAAWDRNNVQISNSDDRITNTASATFAWNILDLGVSYARARQQADETLIKQEQERKALQDIIRQVNAAFWRAAAGQRLLKKVHAIARDLQVAMDASREMERTKATDVISAVAFRRDIVESVKQALAIRRELREAKAELAELLNIRPGTDFELALPAIKAGFPRLPMSIEHLEVFALENRPELRVEKYNERISDWQAREALYNLLPGLKVSAGQNYSSDSNNLSTNWISTGVNMGMNLFHLFSGSSEIEIAGGKAELARRQRLAMSLAVLTQVHMSRIKFHSATQQMRLAHEIAESDRKLTRLVRTDGQFLNNNYFEAVSLATQQLRSEMDEQRAYVDLVSAHADLIHAIGLDVFPDNVPFNDVAALGDTIRAMMMQWNVSDETVTVENAALPLDQLVSNIISTDRRSEYSIAGAPSSEPATKPKQTSGELLSETLFTAEMHEEAAVEVLPPEIPQPIVQATLKDKRPDGLDEEPTTSQSTTASGPTDAEQHIGAQPEEDITPETIERLNEIAPASQGNSSVKMPRTTDRKISIQTQVSESPSTIGNPDKIPATSQSPIGSAAVDGKKHNGDHPAQDIIQAAIRPQPMIAPSSEDDSSPITLRSIDWEFSISGSRDEAPATGPTTVGRPRAGETKHSAAQPEKDFNQATIVPQHKIAPTNEDRPSTITLRAVDWEFSVTGRPDESPATSRIIGGNSWTNGERRNDAHKEKDSTLETIRRLNRIAPSSQGKPSAALPQAFDWEFSLPRPN
jgi:outer membrane protein TolC